MRMMMKIQVPVETGNKALKDGTLPKTVQMTVERIKPESAYFTSVDGVRTGYFFFDLKDSSEIPSISEPIFMALDAKIEFIPVMNPEELKRGLEKALKG